MMLNSEHLRDSFFHLVGGSSRKSVFVVITPFYFVIYLQTIAIYFDDYI